MEIGVPRATPDRLAIFHAWHGMREETRGWTPSVMDAEEYSATFCSPNGCAREMAYFSGDRLVAVGLVDVTAEAASSIYFYYHPDVAECSPGVASVLFEVEWARRMGAKYLYLGYRVLECPSTAYKSRYGPHELLIGRPGFGEAPIGRKTAAKRLTTVELSGAEGSPGWAVS